MYYIDLPDKVGLLKLKLTLYQDKISIKYDNSYVDFMDGCNYVFNLVDTDTHKVIHIPYNDLYKFWIDNFHYVLNFSFPFGDTFIRVLRVDSYVINAQLNVVFSYNTQETNAYWTSDSGKYLYFGDFKSCHIDNKDIVGVGSDGKSIVISDEYYVELNKETVEMKLITSGRVVKTVEVLNNVDSKCKMVKELLGSD